LTFCKKNNTKIILLIIFCVLIIILLHSDAHSINIYTRRVFVEMARK